MRPLARPPSAPLPGTEAAHEPLRGAPSGDAKPAHAALLHGLEAHARNWAQDETPPVLLPQTTSSCVYMLLLLDAAGLLQARARHAWPVHLRFAPWWHGLARPFLSVRNVRSAVEHRLWGAPSTSQFFLV